MKTLTHPLTSHQNLRAYRRSCSLSSDIFWITRRFSNEQGNPILAQLRRLGGLIPDHIIKAWSKRHEPRAYLKHLEYALKTVDELSHWIHVAGTCVQLSCDEHDILDGRVKEVRFLITRLFRENPTQRPFRIPTR